MEEMKKNPNLKYVTIRRIDVTIEGALLHSAGSREEIERLMKFDVFLSNAPVLKLCISNKEDLDSPEGGTLLNFLSNMTFSSIWASCYFPVYNQLLENNFAQKKPIAMNMLTILHPEPFLIEHLLNGNIKRFTSTRHVPFSAELMERIIHRFLENPQSYDHFLIEAQFEESTKEMLEKKLKEESCEKVVHSTKDCAMRERAIASLFFLFRFKSYQLTTNRPTMNRVAVDFRERVDALWKCCETEYGHPAECLDARVPDCKWTMKSKKQLISFFIGHSNGEWSYRFTNPDLTREAKGYLSMDELKKNPNLKNVRIGKIEVRKPSMHPLRSRADIGRLMKFVVFLSNEPNLYLYTMKVKDFISPEGAILLNSLSKMIFSRIWAANHFPVYNQLLENQFSRRKPTLMCIQSVGPNSQFFVEHLGNGNIKKFSGPSDFRFPAELMERLINRFLENPQNYEEFFIKAEFEESTKKMLEKKLKEGRCEKVFYASKDSTEYRFTVNNPELEKNPCLSIELFNKYVLISMC